MADDVILNKVATIEQCLCRITDEYGGDRRNLFDHQTKQEAIVLNLQRACEASIALAIRVDRRKGLRLPQESRDAFALLQKRGLLSPELAGRLQRMVGFCNVVVYDYISLNVEILHSIITSHLDDFRRFFSTIVKACA